jgi:hypothetical protein
MTRRGFLTLPLAAKAQQQADAEKIAEMEAALKFLWDGYHVQPTAIYTPEGRITKDGIDPWGTFPEP